MMANEEGGTTTTTNNQPNWRYDVFLVFRGHDTRYNFTGNLYDALRRKRFNVFMDQGGLKGGDHISLALLKGIQESRISIVVLSDHFADSTYCLNELTQALECRETKNQVTLPIFYGVDPSDVRRQTCSYGKAMYIHEDRYGKDSENVQEWRSALSKIAQLSGFHFRIGQEFEYEAIQRIVERVTQLVPRYDVFLSFCGKDTRYTFSGFLYDAFSREGFKTFMNDEVSEKQDQISEPLITAIEKSRISIIVFSENYAYSSLCLDVLATILHCKKTKNQLVWPIFYKLEPSVLRHQTKSYGTAMTEHVNRFGTDPEKVKKWRSALYDAANLKGWHLITGYEYEFIEKLVEVARKV